MLSEAPWKAWGALGKSWKLWTTLLPLNGRARARSARASAQARSPGLASSLLRMLAFVLRCCSAPCSLLLFLSSAALATLALCLQGLTCSSLTRFPFHDSQVPELLQKPLKNQWFFNILQNKGSLKTLSASDPPPGSVFGGVLEALGGLLEVSWRPLGNYGRPLGRSWRPGDSWKLLEASRRRSEVLGSFFEAIRSFLYFY